MSASRKSNVSTPVSQRLPSSTPQTTASLISTQQQLSNRNRAPTPVLSTDHFRLARSVPHSTVTSVSSQFLSPPVSNPPSTSPPPRVEAEDYLTARADHRQKGKHKARTGHRFLDRRDQSEGTESGRRVLLSGSSSPSFTLSSVGPGEAVNEKRPAGAESPRALSRRKQSYPPASVINDPQQPTVLKIHALLGAKAEPKDDEPISSPASESLRRLSQSVDSRDSSKLRRLSESFSATLGKIQPPRFRDQAKKETQSSFVPETPATITLRKPSKGPYTPTNLSSQHVEKGSRSASLSEAKVAFSELVSFRTTMLSPNQVETPTAPQPENKRTRSSTLGFGSSGKSTPKTLVQFDESPHRRRSPTATTVMTFADTHVVPGTFGTGSRRASLVPGSPSRRLSIVQFKSRDSVHEIIWREGESTSGSSSSRKMSPDRVEQYSTIPETPTSTNGPTESSQRTDGDIAEPGPFSAFDRSLQEWAWNKPAKASSNRPDLQSPHLRERSNITEAVVEKKRQRPIPRKRSKEQSHSSEGSSITSFPPLPSRRSTTGRRTRSVLELRDTETQSQYETEGMQGEREEDGLQGYLTSGRSSSKRQSLPARVGENGRMGSSIGSSSHQRMTKPMS